MERFVQAILAGGLALVAGLWLVVLSEGATTAWLAGVGLSLVGSGALVAGIATEIDY